MLAIALLISSPSCTSNSGQRSKNSSDTLLLKYSEYSRKKLDGFSYRTLIKTETADSVIFEYYDSSGTELYDRLVLLKTPDNKFGLDVHDYFFIHVKDYLVFDSLLLLKYELKNPIIDGDGGKLISPTYGDFGGFSYTWGNSGFLKQWGNTEFPDTLHKVLMADSISWPHYYFYGDGRNRK